MPKEFLLGVELFNDGKFFECHEAWETLWLNSTGIERRFLHAMIQVAATLHHLQQGNAKGATSVGQRAIGLLATMPTTVMQLNVSEFRASLQSFLVDRETAIPFIKLQGEDS